MSENFEYHAAKNEQGLLERRISILRSRLHGAKVIDEAAAAASGVVTVGATVVIRSARTGDGVRVAIESEAAVNKASLRSRIMACLSRRDGGSN